MRLIVMTAAAWLLVGCAGHSIDCTTGNASKDCAPGTEGHQQMLQQQQDKKTVEAIDDARCRTYAAAGTDAYRECRHKLAEDRK